MSVACLIFAFGLSFSWGWLYTCLLLVVVPFLGLTGVGMAVSLESGITQQMRAYSQSAGYAEQALSAIRVVHSYGQEELENINYKKYLIRAT
jgi:ABC-type multidrug transport system fused ATPase/permease subunit